MKCVFYDHMFLKCMFIERLVDNHGIYKKLFFECVEFVCSSSQCLGFKLDQNGGHCLATKIKLSLIFLLKFISNFGMCLLKHVNISPSRFALHKKH